MHDGAPAHRSKAVKKLLHDNHIPVLDWYGISPDIWNKELHERKGSGPAYQYSDIKEKYGAAVNPDQYRILFHMHMIKYFIFSINHSKNYFF